MARMLVLVRHCKSDWNAELRLSGHDNTARLTEKGWSQVRDMVSVFKESFPLKIVDSALIVSSDLTRALGTASVFAQELRYPFFHVDKRLREVHLGNLDGKLREEIKQMPNGNALLASLREGKYDFRSFNGEDEASVLARQVEVIRDILCLPPSDKIIVAIGHGFALQTLLRYYTPNRKLHEQGGYDYLNI